jgi:hypothetical protein
MPTWIPRSQSIEDMIGEILSAQNSPSAQWARRDAAAENETALNNEDYRKRRLLEMQESGATARTGMTVAGNADVENIKNIGQMSRQRLSGQQGMELGQQKGEFDVRGHEITAAGNVEAHNLWAGAERYKADAARDKIIGGTPEEQSLLNSRAVLHSKWAEGKTPEEVMQMTSKMNPANIPSGSDKNDFYGTKTGTVTPTAAYHPPILPVSAPSPAPNETGLSLIGRQDRPWWERRKKQLTDLDESKFGKFITGQ